MASTTVRARRVTEPTLSQKQSLGENGQLEELANAWENITDAKSALYRAEARMEHLETHPPSSEPRLPHPSSRLEQRHPAGARLPVDSVPSLEVRASPSLKSKPDQKSRNHPYDKPKKKVTIKEGQRSRESLSHPPDLTASTVSSHMPSAQHTDSIPDATITTQETSTSSKPRMPYRGTSAMELTELPGESSSRDILGNGSANLSIGSSSEIRVLNDIRAPSLVRQSSTVEVSPGLRVSKDYIPAYDRLFGDNPVLKLRSQESTPDVESRKLLQMISSSSKTRDLATLSHMERLRERVQQQKIMASKLSDSGLESQRQRHQENDPVRTNCENEVDFLLGFHVAPKVPVRKVASAPPAPTYKGFNQAETRFQVPNGGIVTDEQLKRKTSRPSVNANNRVSSFDQPQTKPLRPLQRHLEHNQLTSQAHAPRAHQKSVRKVRKAPLPNAKPKKPETTGSISARAWREGQKTVRKVLGPPPKIPKQTVPPGEHALTDHVQNSQAISEANGNRTEDEVDRLSEHPLDSDHEAGGPASENLEPPMGRLPHEAQEVLNDLHLDHSDDGGDSSPHPSESKPSKNNNNGPKLSHKKKITRLKASERNLSSAPVQKVRHYQAEEVQKYMAKQRADRRKRQLEERKHKALVAEKKKEQLHDLYKRQRESAKVPNQRAEGIRSGVPPGSDHRALDETFSRGPGIDQQQQQVTRPVSLQRPQPYHDHYKRMDVTGSDKENRAFWSTSSSDSSLRSSPQTDLSASTPQDPHPAGLAAFHDIPYTPSSHPYHQQDTAGVGSGRDIVLEPVREEEAPPKPLGPPPGVIKNQLSEQGGDRGSKEMPSAGVGPTHLQSVIRPRPANSVAKPRTKAERIAAIKATAAALQGRLENEVRQLTGDLSNLAANALSPQGQLHPGSPAARWAYPIPEGAAPVSVGEAPLHGARPAVRFSLPQASPPGLLTRQQRVAGADQDYSVFTGLLPGVSNLSQQAHHSEKSREQSSAATTIQAAFRGHQVRQKLNWELPSGRTLKHRRDGEVPIPQIRLSSVTRPQPSNNLSGQEKALQSDGESLSEGPLSDESSEAEVDQEYTPKFKSLPSRVQTRLRHPPDSRQTNLNFSPGSLPVQGPERDGLSVIDIYMRRYQEEQRELLARQRASPPHPSNREKSPAPRSSALGPAQPPTYSDDFTEGSRTLSSFHTHSRSLDSPDNAGSHHSPIPSSASADNISELSSSRSNPSGRDATASRPPTGRSISLPSPGKDSTLSAAGTANSLSISDKKRSRTPSPRPTSLRDAGTQTPPSSRSSPASVKSRSSSSRGSHSPPSDARSPVSDHHKSPVDEIRSLIEDLKKSTSQADQQSHSEGVGSRTSPGISRSSQGHDPSSRQSPTPLHLTQGGGAGQGLTSPSPAAGGRNAGMRSPVTKEVLTHFKPIRHPGREVPGRSHGQDPSGSSMSTMLSSTISTQPGTKFLSPAALQLKMAAELNLLETLEESARQLSEAERARSTALAQRESASLARILQGRQRDHDRELAALSAKARHEVEEAQRQLEEARHRAANTAQETERVTERARREAETANSNRESAQRILQTQVDAARVTAQAAKTLADTQKAAATQPAPPPPPPPVDPHLVAAESAKAATSAAVLAALEQQRLQQLDMLKEMRASLLPPPPVTRSVAAGSSRPSSLTPSRTAESKTPSAQYSEDFTHTASAASIQSPSPTTTPSFSSASSHHVPTAQDSSLSDVSHSIRTASDVPAESLHSSFRDRTDSVATASDLVADRDQSKSVTASSINTDSGAREASIGTRDTISEDLNKTRSGASDQYSISFENSNSNSDSEHSSIPSVVSPMPSKPDGRKDTQSAGARPVVSPGQMMTPSKDRADSQASVLSDQDVSLSAVTIERIQRQLKEEEARSQQQVTLLKLREKVLVDKTNAELEWLEHQKKRLKEKEDLEGVTSLRKRQRALLTKLQAEQAEIKAKLGAQKQSSLERQRLLHQQQDITRLRRAASRYKDQIRSLPAPTGSHSPTAGPPSPSPFPAITTTTTPLASPIEGEDRSQDSSLSDSSSLRLLPSPPALSPGGLENSSQDPLGREKQARVMQRLKMLQQPLNTKVLMKREVKLKRRRKNAEELLAWKQRLDEEEKQVANMEQEVLHLWEGPKQRKPTKPASSDRQGRERSNASSSPSSSLQLTHNARTDGDISEEMSFKSSNKSEPSSLLGKSKSDSHRSSSSSIKTALSNKTPGSGSDASSMAEELRSRSSSIAEQITSDPDKTQSAQSISESPHLPGGVAGGDLSSDDTIKEASAFHEYTSDSFESSAADHTLTPSKLGSSSGGGGSKPRPATGLTPPSPSLASRLPASSSTPKPVGGVGGVTAPTRRGPPGGFLPHQRTRHPSDSGSESEKSFSQNMSETASDQSDIEGRVRALKDALKRRKMEADRLRKQQKRLNREKLKAQEASLKKQLETYDSFIANTKAELEEESKLVVPSSAKPQIKQPKAVGTTDSLRHARALRQRTASDSSQEGGAASIHPPVKGRSGSESGRSSRSSLEGGVGIGVGTGVERPASFHGSSRDISYSSFSATSSPASHHSEGGMSPKSPHSLSRDRSVSASSSIAEDISIRSDYSDRESLHDSEKFDSEDHRRIKEKVQRQREGSEEGAGKGADDVSMSPVAVAGARRSGDGRDAEESVPKVTQAPATPSPLLQDRRMTSSAAAVDNDDDVSVTSSVPEEILSAVSTRTQDSLEESKLALNLTHSTVSDHDRSEHIPSVASTHSSLVEERGNVGTLLDDASPKSAKSVSSSVRSRSSTHQSPQSQSPKMEAPSYSEDFIGSSAASEPTRTKSDTDDDISEQLSEVSVARSNHSQKSGHLVFGLGDKPQASATQQGRSGLDPDLPEVTVTPRSTKDIEEKEGLMDDRSGKPEERLEALGQEVVLPDFRIGERVLIGGAQPGTLRFKGPTHFATGIWAGVELDTQVGTNNGTIEGVSYFSCRPNYGIFAPHDKLTSLPEKLGTIQREVGDLDLPVSEASSVEEDLPSESSVKTVSESEPLKIRSIGKDIQESSRSKETEVEDDEKESERSLSQLTSLKSEDLLHELTEDELSEGGIDDDALEKLISNAAEAVESFSHDEPGVAKQDVAMDTPRGAPEPESPDIEELPIEDEEEEKRDEAENNLVDSITDHLTEAVVKDTLDAMLEVAGKQQLEEKETEQKSTDNLLKLLVSGESPRSDSELSEVPTEKAEAEVSEKVAKENVEHKADSVAKSLLNDAISEMLNLRRQRNIKVEEANKRMMTLGKQDSVPEESHTPEDIISPELRVETPYTPDKSPERPVDAVSPLDDDIFINRVHVESSSGNDNLPVARPGSPVFGESGSVSPEALNEKLEQLQLLDKDILEADLFGDQEWFDDEFGSMQKSNSIIKVPERVVSPKSKPETPAGVEAQEARVAAKQRRDKLDLKKIVEEPFYAVPHSINEVKDITSKSVKVFHEAVLNEEPIASARPPLTVLSSDTKGTDIESTSRHAYKNLIFTLSGEVYQAISKEQEATVQPPWIKPKRKPRRYFFQQPPTDKAQMTEAVEDRVLKLSGLVSKHRPETAHSGSKLSKKKDHVDEILIDELKEEEPEWIDYDNDELSVKMQLTDALFESLLVDTAMVLHQIEDRRKVRESRSHSDHFSHQDVEF